MYKAIVTDSVGCSQGSNKVTPVLIACFTHLGETGIGQDRSNTGEITVIVHPNPVSENLNVSLSYPGHKENIRVSMFDITGKIVFSHVLNIPDSGNNRFEVPVSSLPDGIYTLWIMDGEKIYSERVVISH